MKPVVKSGFGWNPPLQDRAWSVSVVVDYDCGGGPWTYNFEDTADFRVFIQMEPPCIFDITDKLIAEQGKFDLILAWNPKILEACDNARYFINSNCSLYDGLRGHCGMDFDLEKDGKYPAPTEKKFGVSFVTSNKAWAPGHQLRHEIFNALPRMQLMDISMPSVFRHMSPPIIDKRLISEPFQFEIAVENCSMKNYFTDKLIDPFVAKTVPIYWGATNVGDFFDPAGIITFTNVPDLLVKLRALTPETYESMRPAVEDNYKRAHEWAQLVRKLDDEITAGLERRCHVSI